MITAFTYAFIIIFIHACMQEGMILGKLRWALDDIIAYDWARKPLYECVVCMSGLWTVILWFVKDRNALSIELLWTLLTVGGIITILAPIADAMILEFHRNRTNDE